MTILYAVLGAMVILALSLFFGKIKIIFGYCKNYGEKTTSEIEAVFFGGLVKLNLKDFSSKNRQKMPKKKKKKTDEAPSDESLIRKIQSFAEAFSILKQTYQKSRWFIKKRITAESIKIYIKFGLGDAAATGIAVGALWTFLYRAFALVSVVGTVKEHDFEVVPVFDNRGFCSNGKGIISFRLINIIAVAIKLFFTYKSVKKSYES